MIITEEQKEKLCNLLRGNPKARKNKAQTCQADHAENTWDEVRTKTRNIQTLKDNKKQKRDQNGLQALQEMRKEWLKMETQNFEGVGR